MERMRARRVAFVLGLVASLATSAFADDEPDPGVQDLVARAQRHFDLGEYAEAIAGFREAYRVDPRPALLYNLAQAYRLDGDCVTAAFMYRGFVREAPDSKHRPMAEEQLAAIATCEREQRDAVAPPPVTIAPVTTTPAPRRGARLRLAGIVTGATGAVVAAVGGYFAWDATRAAREVSDGYRDGATWAELDAIDARGRRAEVAGGVLIGIGAAGVVSGAALYMLGWRADRAEVRPRDGGGELVVSWRF